jgi:hypothetical protein
MKKANGNLEGAASARKLPANARKFLLFAGRKYPMVLERGVWRVRSRAKSHPASFSTGSPDFSAAKIIAADMLGKEATEKKRTKETLEDLATVYLDLPKRCSDKVAELNVGRLRAVVRKAWGKELAAVKIHQAGPKLWRDYMAKRQALESGKLDLATRRPENAAINAAVRMACSLFIERLRPAYAERGIHVAADATVVQWLPEMHAPPAAADGAGLLEAWAKLKESNRPLWLAIGLARFAGLRRSEIEHCQGCWIIEEDGTVFVELRDRPGLYLTKTGRIYRAAVIHAGLAEALRTVAPGDFVVEPGAIDRHKWFESAPAEWSRSFTGDARKPLHRLRGLYADDIRKISEDAMTARLAAIRAASKALGHTSTATTVDHYLSGHALR